MRQDEVTITFAPFGLTPTGEVNLPHPTQQKILQWAEDVRAGRSTAKGIPVLYAQGGWRSGKTSVAIAVVQEIMQDYPGVRVLIGRKDFNDLRLSTMESWRETRDKVFVRHEDKQEHREEWVNGSQVFFRELKDLEGLGGQEFGVILVSEPYELEQDVYLRLKGRLSQKGMPRMLLLEGNPPNAGHWLHKLIMGDSKTAPDQDVTFFKVSTDENKAALPPAYWTSIETAPVTWQKKYRLGEFGFTPEGQPVYDIFKEHIHVRDVGILKDRPIIRSWDSGVRHPACLWAQTNTNGQLLIQYEWLGIETSLTEFAKGVILRTNEYYASNQMVVDYGDPAMYARSPQTGKSDAQMLYENHKIQFKGRQSTHQERKSMIDSKLLLNIHDGSPTIMIHPRCKVLIDGLLGGYHYPKRDESQPFSKRHESPEKDGFYEHLCLHGDTKVRTLHGYIPIRELVGKTCYVWSYSHDERRMVPSKIGRVWSNGERPVMKLTYTGGSLIGTSEHPVCLRSGEFVTLGELQPGAELMPFYDRLTQHGMRKSGRMYYPWVYLNDGTSGWEHRIAYAKLVGNLRDGYQIDHIDGDTANNEPENLQLLSPSDHSRKTASWMHTPKGKGTRSPMSLEAIENACRRLDAVRQSGDKHWTRQPGVWTSERREAMSKTILKMQSGLRRVVQCKQCGERFNGIYSSQFCGKNCVSAYWRKTHPNYYTQSEIQVRKMVKLQARTPENHKVISVEPYGVSEVFDLSIAEGPSNFVANGIVVHNCNSFEYLLINIFGLSSDTAKKFISRKRVRENRMTRTQQAVYF